MLTNRPFFLANPSHPDQACLLLHGLGGGVYEMELLGQSLYEHGYTVQGIAYPGHDRAAEKMPASTWQEWFAHIQATYTQLQAQYHHITVIGFSTGCPLALQLASQVPVQRLVLLSPYLAIRYQWFYLLPAEAYLYTLGYAIEDLPRLGLPIRDRAMKTEAERVIFFRTFNTKAVRSAAELITFVKPKVPDIRVPTLIVQPKRDRVVAPWGAQWLYDHLGSQDKMLRWLEDSDHIVPLDLEREQVFRWIRDFLAPSH
jgi:carboxylesterase